MRLLEINGSIYGSTGEIMKGTAEISQSEYLLACANSKSNKKRGAKKAIYIGNRVSRNINLYFGRLTGLNSVLEQMSTKRFLRKVSAFAPDVIHLHNLHNSYINLPMLFRYIKKYNIPIVWTLHDCWAFTGHCPYFTIAECEKWKTGCHHCSTLCEYPTAYIDHTKTMWKWKRKWFTSVKNLTVVTPSRWLADLVKESFFSEYTIKVIYNGIDLQVFKPTISDFRAKYGIGSKYMLLGVAFGWGKRKGLDVFMNLAERLSEQYQIVLVGTDEDVDKLLSPNIISIHRTQNQTELAEIYTAADLFVNPTREEVLGLVNIEALACGTPVLTFNTGGSPECIDETCGSVVDCDDIDAMENEIIRMCELRPYSKENCVKRAKQFDRKDRFEEYRRLYQEKVK